MITPSTPSTEHAKPAAAFVISTLFFPVPTPSDLPLDVPLYRRSPDNNMLEPFEWRGANRAQLVADIKEGRIYAAWGQHFTTLNDITNWAGACLKPATPPAS